MTTPGNVEKPAHRLRRGGEVATVSSAFVTYGAIFFDRLAPLYLVALIAAGFGVPSAYEGTLALLIGLGWAAAMPIVRSTSGRFGDRDRIVVAAVLSGLLSMASTLSPGWIVFVLLRGLGGIASSSGSPAVTSLVFASSPPERRGVDLGIVQSSTRIIGSLVSPVVVTAVAVVGGWRAAMLVSGTLLVASAGLLVWAVPEDRHSRRNRRAVAHHAYELHPGGRRDLLLCVAGCVLLLAWLTVWSQSSVPLVQGWLDVGPDVAGRLVGWFGIGSGIGALVIPMSSDRIGRRSALAIATGLGGAGGMVTGVLAAVGTVPHRGMVLILLFLGGVAMGGLPLVISIIPAEAVASGDVARALIGPIAGGEILGAAALPLVAAAAAVPLGPATVLAITAAGVLAVAVISGLLRPPEASNSSAS